MSSRCLLTALPRERVAKPLLLLPFGSSNTRSNHRLQLLLISAVRKPHESAQRREYKAVNYSKWSELCFELLLLQSALLKEKTHKAVLRVPYNFDSH